MPTIACGDDDPLPGEENNINQQQQASSIKKRPHSANVPTPQDFENKFSALSARLGTVPSNNNNISSSRRGGSATASASSARRSTTTTTVNANDILKNGGFNPSTLKMDTTQTKMTQQKSTVEEEETPISGLAEDLLQEFQEIDEYHYNLEKEREAKEREEELAKRRREKEQMKQYKKMLKEQRKERGGSSHEEEDDRQTTYSKFSTATTTMTNVSVALKRDDLYELPASVANNTGVLKRRHNGAIKATTGYRQMFSNNQNQHQEAQKTLLEKVPTTSTTSSHHPQQHNTINRSSSRTSSSSVVHQHDNHPQPSSSSSSATTIKPAGMTFSNNPYNPINRQHERLEKLRKEQKMSTTTTSMKKTKGEGNENVSADAVNDDNDVDDDEEEEDEEEVILEDEGAIKFCCFKICSRNKKTGKFECSVCHKVFDHCENDDDENENTEKHSISTDIMVEVVGADNNKDGNPSNTNKIQQDGQGDKPIVLVNNNNYIMDDDGTGEREQQRLFQLAVLEWRGVASNKNKHEEVESSSKMDDADEAIKLDRERRCPDVSQFVYFAKLWKNLIDEQNLHEDDW